MKMPLNKLPLQKTQDKITKHLTLSKKKNLKKNAKLNKQPKPTKTTTDPPNNKLAAVVINESIKFHKYALGVLEW